ncbi:MAG TPA: Trm112 family protein [Gemmatimonadales bacterium]|nr:Trm112 family protein [Gemmatimonadales bacterium]
MSLAPDLLDLLVCPKCKGPLEHRAAPPAPREELVCHACRLIYGVEDDIPIMLIDEARHF